MKFFDFQYKCVCITSSIYMKTQISGINKYDQMQN